jgi:hypothetical protein
LNVWEQTHAEYRKFSACEDCERPDIQLILGVFSTGKRAGVRQTIRETWMSDPWVCPLSGGQKKHCVVYTAFVLDSRGQAEKAAESEADVLLLNPDEDADSGNTWGFFHDALLYPWATHIGKLTDDTFPFMRHLLNSFKVAQDQPFTYMGLPCHVRELAAVARAGAVCEERSQHFKHIGAIDYMQGDLYVMSRELVAKIATEGQTWDTLKSSSAYEDVLAGYVVEDFEKKTQDLVFRWNPQPTGWYRFEGRSSLTIPIPITELLPARSASQTDPKTSM